MYSTVPIFLWLKSQNVQGQCSSMREQVGQKYNPGGTLYGDSRVGEQEEHALSQLPCTSSFSIFFL